MTSPEHALAIETATLRLLRVGLTFGLAGSLVALLTTLQTGTSLTVVMLAVAWSGAWMAVAIRPQAIVWLLGHWCCSLPVVVCLSVATILETGGFDSLLKTEAVWVAWASPVVLGTSASLLIASLLSAGLLTAFLLDGMSLHDVLAGPDRYTAVTDIANPIVVVLVSLALTGVFRAVLMGAADSLQRARAGGPASSPGLGRLLAGQPVLALPAGTLAPPGEPALPASPAHLSPAERKIVDLLAEGLTPQQIALQRQRSVETVYDQIASAKKKVGATTIEHLVVRAWHPPS